VWILERVLRSTNNDPSKGGSAEFSPSATRELLAKKRVWVACEYEDHLPYILQYAGEDNLIIGTDYGHTDPTSNVRALREFAERIDIGDRVKKKIVRDNALVFYGIGDQELPYV
jgi:predicted TIM-barrel fold metal-dependent hydrolase